jgi:arylsulfatase A-like enzyme
MTERRPNVIFLSIDSLRLDHTGLAAGGGRSVTPRIDRLAENAVICENAFSLGPFTQSACIQFMTSSRPLSYGGFDGGAWGRPKTILHRFHDAGYRTTAFSTLHWVNRFTGYGEGIDAEHQLFTLNSLVGVCVGNAESSLSLFGKGELSAADMLRVVTPVFRHFFRSADEYCALRGVDGGAQRKAHPESLLVNAGYDYRRVSRVIAKHREAFERDPESYVRQHFETIPDAHEWIARDWYYCRRPMKLVTEALFRLTNRLVRLANPDLALCRDNRFKSYVDAHSIADSVIGAIGAADRDAPFFMWAHFMDNHLPYVSGRGRKWYRQTPDILAELGLPADINPAETFRDVRPDTPERWAAYSALYQAAIFDVDRQIGRIVDALAEAGLADDTVVALCSDHGEEFGEHGNYAHFFTFYDHNVRVPLLFHGPGIGHKRVDSLVSLLDVAPTLAELAGLDPDPEWDGRNVASAEAAGRDHVVMETFFGGNCEFARRPLYFAVRSRGHKYMWKEYRDPRDSFTLDGSELYDVAADPAEKNNLYRPDHPVAVELHQAIVDRTVQIAEIDAARTEAIKSSVGSTG